MKKIIIATLLAIWAMKPSWAKNTVTTVAQVTEAITLTEDVDYHISSDVPFTETGSVNISNTEHAVVIMDALKPSLAAKYLAYIKINGDNAVDGTNCQLKLYNRGAILLPYGGAKFRPLTIFDEANCQGNEYNNLTEGHTNGFMKNLPTAWNNRASSFRLKRGYMVTFALGDAGAGYSCCFIAADNDIEVNFTHLMDKRVSSFRLFKWYDTGKAALANDTRASSVDILNVTSCYSFSLGESRLPDAECVPHHIYEDWPSASACGQVGYSPHLKTNNEPGNSADDRPQSVDEVLANWQNLMRTGLRLCSPSSHDGSLGHLRACLDSIDARGWRCDIIDLHCYWPESSFNTWSFYNQWANSYKRPIWISEWVWGASWNSNGAFANGVTEAQNKSAIERITNNLNSWDCVERYYYWNSERDPSKIIRGDGSLTPAGEYYASIQSPLAYSGSINYVPKDPPTKRPHEIKAQFTANTMSVKLTWTMRNGELSDSVEVLRAYGKSKKYNKIAGFSQAEVAAQTKMSYTDKLEEPGVYKYIIRDITYEKKQLDSDEATVTIAGSEKGLPDIQFGSVTAIPGETANIFFADGFDEYPALVGGGITYSNTGTGTSAKGMVHNYSSSSKINGKYKYASYREQLWDGVSATNQETVNFIVGKSGNGMIGNLHYEMGFVPLVEGEAKFTNADDISYSNAITLSNMGDVVREVKFKQPFEDVPVVMLTPLSLGNKQLTMWRIWDVTKEGFKMMLMREAGNTVTTKQSMRVCYLAMEQGQGSDGLGKLYTVSNQSVEFNTTTATQELTFDKEVENPTVLAQLQTNYQLAQYEANAGAILRLDKIKSNSIKVYMQVDKSNKDMIISKAKPAEETIGFIRISDDPDYDSVREVKSEQQTPAGVYTITGIRLDSPTRPGLYIINGKKVMVK